MNQYYLNNLNKIDNKITHAFEKTENSLTNKFAI